MKFKKILEEAAQKYAFQPNKETNPPHNKDYHQKEPVQFKKPKEVPDSKDNKLPKAEKDQQDVLDRMEDTAELANDYNHECVPPEGQAYSVNESDAVQMRQMMNRLQKTHNTVKKEDTEYDRGTDIGNPPAEPASPIASAAPMPNDPAAPVNSDSDSRIALKSIVKQMIQKYGLDSVLSAVEKVKAAKDPSIAAEPVGQTEPDNMDADGDYDGDE